MKVRDWYDNSSGECVVFFPWRTLAGLTSEPVPAYSCPRSGPLIGVFGVPGATIASTDYQWLFNASYAPLGTTVPNGVAVEGLGWIGITIPKALLSVFFSTPLEGQAVGTHPAGASATNWGNGSAFLPDRSPLREAAGTRIHGTDVTPRACLHCCPLPARVTGASRVPAPTAIASP